MNDAKKPVRQAQFIRPDVENEEQMETTTPIKTKTASASRGIREANLRAEEIRNRMRENEESANLYDEFYIDPRMIPEGWDYNWKRQEIAGQPDPAYEVELLQAGWEPVPSERHPSMVPPGHKGPITKKGMILMERPSEISNLAKQRELSTAREAVAAKERALGMSSSGQFERDPSKTGVRKSFEPMNIPKN